MRILTLLLAMASIVACSPNDDVDLPDNAALPTGTLTLTPLPDNGNYIEVRVESSSDIFVVDYNNGQTTNSRVDTAYFPVAGTYEIDLILSGAGGQTTITEAIEITTDDQAICVNDVFVNLTGGCFENGKTWKWSTVAGAITVGPVRGSGEWYTSPEAGLAPEQFDDVYTFFAEDNRFLYENEGLTIDPAQGFSAVPFSPDQEATWELSFGTGPEGQDQIILSDGSFMGTLDSGNVLNIKTLTETELVIQVEFTNGGGWFEFYFVAA